MPNTQYAVSDTTIQAVVGINIDVRLSDALAFGTTFPFTNVTFLPLGMNPPRFVVDTTGTLWDGTGINPLSGGAPPPPPPPPPSIMFTTLPGLFQQQSTDGVPQNSFRLCPDNSGLNCQAFVKP